MLKKLLVTALIASLSLVMTACGGEKEEPTTDDDAMMEEDDSMMEDEDEDEDMEEEEEEEEISAEPGEIPFDFPMEISTDAVAGEYVLAPSRAFLDEGFREGGENSTFIFYAREMVEPGDLESTIKEIIDEVTMPNSMIVRIPAGQTAEPGDIVLTWWQSGSGMQRAIVVEGGTPTEPMAKYLDLGLENEPETLEADSFVVLTEEMQPGTTVAVKDGDDWINETIIRQEGDQVLTIGWAGRMAVRAAADVAGVPVKPTVAEGDTVWVPVIGTYNEGTVVSINEEYGEVTVEYEWAGSTSEEAIPYGDILTELPS